jgi:hypothetical protein
MAIHANRRSTDALALQLDRIDAMVASGRAPPNAASGWGNRGRRMTAPAAAGADGEAPSAGTPPLKSKPRLRFSQTISADQELEVPLPLHPNPK